MKLPHVVRDVLGSPGRPLDDETRTFFELSLGRDLGNVRIHADARAGMSAKAVNAHAFTVGHQLVFDTGRYAPHTGEGRRLIAHELAHVVQQLEAAPRMDADLDVSGPADAEEKEAERFAESIGRATAVSNSSIHLPRQRVSRAMLQRESTEGCSAAETHHVTDAVTRGHADIGSSLRLMSQPSAADRVANALWLAFRADSPRLWTVVQDNLRTLSEAIIRAHYVCRRYPEQAYVNNCQNPSSERKTYGYANPLGGPLNLCMPEFSTADSLLQARTVVHEAAHRYLKAEDTGYFTAQCSETESPSDPTKQEGKGTAGDNPAVRLNNADAWACLIYFLTHIHRRVVQSMSEGLRGRNLQITPETRGVEGTVIYTKTNIPSEPSFRIAGVPSTSGFRFRWRLEIGGARYSLDALSSRDTSVLDERNFSVFVSQSVRASLAQQGERSGTIICEVELFRPYPKHFVPPLPTNPHDERLAPVLITKQLEVTIAVGQDPADPTMS